jgi:hypothetical protein
MNGESAVYSERVTDHEADIEVTFSVCDLFFLICGISIPL